MERGGFEYVLAQLQILEHRVLAYTRSASPEAMSLTMQVFDSLFVFCLELFKLVQYFAGPCRLLFPDEKQLSELMLEMFGKKVHPSTTPELFQDSNCQTRVTSTGVLLGVLSALQSTSLRGSGGLRVLKMSRRQRIEERTLVDMTKLP
jgi:hypothetical protein